VNLEAEGTTFPPVPFVVAPERVQRFADVVGQRAAGVPPTFLTAAEFAVFPAIIADPNLGLDLRRVLHGDQEYVLHRAPVPGETLTVRSRVAQIRERGGTGFVVLEAEITDADGEVVAVARATMIERTA
jgi:acyl dehydratase